MQIETQRLLFKKIENEDVEKLFRIFNDKDLTKYFASGTDKTAEQTARRVKKIISHWGKYKFGDFIIFDKKTLEPIGFGGLHYKRDGGNINISYIVAKDFWGQGYGYEITQTLIEYGFNTLGLTKIVAEIDPQNIPSIKLVEKYGFQYNRTIEYEGFERFEYIISNPELCKNTPKE